MKSTTVLISIIMVTHRQGSIVLHRCQSCTMEQAQVLPSRRTEGARTVGDGVSTETETELDSSVAAETIEGDPLTESIGVDAAMIDRVAGATFEVDQGVGIDKASEGGADRQGDLNRRINVRLRGSLTPRQMSRGLHICSARHNF